MNEILIIAHKISIESKMREELEIYEKKIQFFEVSW